MMVRRQALFKPWQILGLLLLLLALLALAKLGPIFTHVPSPQSIGTASQKLSGQEKLQTQESYAKLPLSFEENRGQTDKRVEFISRGPGYSLFLTPNEAIFTLSKQSGDKTTSDALHMKLIGANATPEVAGVDKLPGTVNYLTGSDPTKWKTDIPTYSKVQYKGIYPGVDLIYYGNQRQLEYDFVVAPGADPAKIKLSFVDAKKLAINNKGELVISTANATIIQKKPFIYQRIGNKEQEVSGSYVLDAEHNVSFKVGSYDTTKPLVIDPVLLYSTYLGGTFDDRGHAIAVDGSGAAYVVGGTTSDNFPTTPGAYQTTHAPDTDAFVTKLNPAGTALVYSTYLGGTGFDYGYGIAVDGTGAAYVVGNTTGSFPVKDPLQGYGGGAFDAFVAKLNAAGADLVYSTYLGGTSADHGRGIAVDGTGAAYVAGGTHSDNFPTTTDVPQQTLRSAPDAFATKLNAAGAALSYSTYLGGTGDDFGNAIAVDGSGAAYVAGATRSGDFIVKDPLQGFGGGIQADAFISRLSADTTPTPPTPPETPTPPSCSDVPEGAWYKPFFDDLIAKGIINGYPDGTCRPNNNITRAEFTKMIILAVEESQSAASSSFSDVANTFWARGYIERARELNIVTGYPDGTFKPNNNISRQEIAAIVIRAGGFTPEATFSPVFPDVPSTLWSWPFILEARDQTIVTGYPDGTFRPTNPATRAEASKMIKVMIDTMP